MTYTYYTFPASGQRGARGSGRAQGAETQSKESNAAPRYEIPWVVLVGLL